MANRGFGTPQAAAGESTGAPRVLCASEAASRDERETCASGFSAGSGLRQPGARGPGASTRGALLGGEGSPPGGKHEILKLDLLVDAIPGGEDAEQSTKHHIEECGEHGRDSATHGRSGASGARETGPEGHDRVFAPDERANFSDSCFSLMPWFTATSVKAAPRSGSVTSHLT
jgi:hypothetical protein